MPPRLVCWVKSTNKSVPQKDCLRYAPDTHLIRDEVSSPTWEMFNSVFSKQTDENLKRMLWVSPSDIETPSRF